MSDVAYTNTNTVQRTLIMQLEHLNPMFVVEYNIKAVILMDENTIRLHSKGKGQPTVNIDIKYNIGSDLYEIKAYKIKRFDFRTLDLGNLDPITIYDETGIFWDQLNDIIQDILGRARSD